MQHIVWDNEIKSLLCYDTEKAQEIVRYPSHDPNDEPTYVIYRTQNGRFFKTRLPRKGWDDGVERWSSICDPAHVYHMVQMHNPSDLAHLFPQVLPA